MKILVAYLIWFVVTVVWSLIVDTEKNAVLGRFVFTFIVMSLYVFFFIVPLQNEA